MAPLDAFFMLSSKNYVLLRQEELDLRARHFHQVGNEHHFISVFMSQVGKTFHFMP